MLKNEPRNRMLSKFVRFSGMGLQMGLTIYVASLIGDWLDRTYQMEGVSFFKILTILAVFGTTYSIIRQVIKMGQEDEK
jgi:hypothetical protein